MTNNPQTLLFTAHIAQQLSLPERQIEQTLHLLHEGATIPFISRYRKERTGGLDEVAIARIASLEEQLAELQKRKETIYNTIEKSGKLTDSLKKQLADCWDTAQLEDLYLPYKPKRKTRAEKARQQGLEGLANIIQSQNDRLLSAKIATFIKGTVTTQTEALQGARDIIAERINESAPARQRIRQLFHAEGILSSELKKEHQTPSEAREKYRDYFHFQVPIRHCPYHRILALRRGAAEGFLQVSIAPANDERCLAQLRQRFIKSHGTCAQHIEQAIADAYKRLLKPSIENEIWSEAKEKADREAIAFFADNLRQLLLAPPLGEKRILALDPGFRTGCKLVCLDAQGALLYNDTIYPHPPHNKQKMAASKLTTLVKQYKIEAIAIGNGTAGRETEQFVTSLSFPHPVSIFVVPENGASVYSASPVAREEFPQYDVTVRGAISIGRRLIDPLSELVKIEPQSIGVGQYQHDVNQNELKKVLDQTVESCVNKVGVNLNTASYHLLAYVSGLGKQLAKNIVDYRNQNGAFTSRKELMQVPRLGSKAFEQCAGFLRIIDGEYPLDNSAIHPERYALVEQIAQDYNYTVKELLLNKEMQSAIDWTRYLSDKIGMPTLLNIKEELDKPGRDPRNKPQAFQYNEHIRTINDLKEGMSLNGIISNITSFGCFVDIGIHENGLIHISQLSDRFVSDPREIVFLHQHVKVTVLKIDRERKRIELSMKAPLLS